jgi:hypothetical protein
MRIEIFISYSHLDEEEKNELLRHLSVLRHQELFDLWSDDRIKVGEPWKTEIEDALIRARVAILLVTKNFLNSDFILNQEVPEILEHHKQELTIIPVIARDCAWRSVEWLARLQVFNDGLAVWRDEGKHIDKELTEITYLVAEIAKEAKTQERSGQGPPEEPMSEVGTASARQIVASTQTAAVTSLTEEIPAALPTFAHVLFISAALIEEKNSKAWPSFLQQKKKSSEFATISSQLYSAVNAEVLAKQSNGDGQLSCQSREEGMIVATSGEAATLLLFAISVLQSVKAIGGMHLRMGLHSGEIEPLTLNKRTQLPNDIVYSARRVMELGRGGHLLASQQAAELLRKDAEFASVFHSSGSRTVEPPDSLQIYNVYKRGTPGDEKSDFGNDNQPLPEIPETVVRRFSAPRRLRALKGEWVRVTFRPGRSYIKSKFEFTDSDGNKAHGVRINCHKHGERGCSFEYRFNDSTEEHKPKFKIVAEDPPADLSLVMEMSCYNEYDELLAPPYRRSFRLLRVRPLPPIKEPLSLIAWLWDRLMRLPRAVRPAVFALLLVSSYFWVPPLIPEGIRKSINYNYEFYKRRYWHGFDTYDKKVEEKFLTEQFSFGEFSENWNFDEGQVGIVKGRGGEKKNALLVLSGPKMITLKLEPAKALYDYEFDLWFKFAEGDKAAWVVRSQQNRQAGYVFVLRKSGSDLVLEGFTYKDLNTRIPIETQIIPTGLDSFYASDYFQIKAMVKEFTFKHSISIHNYDSREARIQRGGADVDLPNVRDFTDESEMYRYGSVGVLSFDEKDKPATSKMHVERYYVIPEPFP